MSPLAFFRAFPTRADTICSEPVVAWAHYRGRRPVSRFSQMRLWRRAGAEAGAMAVARRMGLCEIAPQDAREGDAVLLVCQDGARVLGVNCGLFSAAATGGRVHVGRFAIIRAWGLQ